jgi:hypothetical protein
MIPSDRSLVFGHRGGIYTSNADRLGAETFWRIAPTSRVCPDSQRWEVGINTVYTIAPGYKSTGSDSSPWHQLGIGDLAKVLIPVLSHSGDISEPGPERGHVVDCMDQSLKHRLRQFPVAKRTPIRDDDGWVIVTASDTYGPRVMQSDNGSTTKGNDGYSNGAASNLVKFKAVAAGLEDSFRHVRSVQDTENEAGEIRDTAAITTIHLTLGEGRGAFDLEIKPGYDEEDCNTLIRHLRDHGTEAAVSTRGEEEGSWRCITSAQHR